MDRPDPGRQQPCGIAGASYGRLWGGRAAFDFLHFAACYDRAIEFAVEHGLAEPVRRFPAQERRSLEHEMRRSWARKHRIRGG